MRKRFVSVGFLVGLLAGLVAVADRPEYAWSVTFNEAIVIDVEEDAAANVYVITHDNETTDEAIADVSGNAMRLVKVSSDGSVLWQKVLASNNSRPHDLIVADDGFIYVTGDFRGTTTFDPEGTAVTMTAAEDLVTIDDPDEPVALPAYNTFVLKIGVNGNVAWVTSWGAEERKISSFLTVQALRAIDGSEARNAMAIAPDGRVYVYVARAYVDPRQSTPQRRNVLFQSSASGLELRVRPDDETNCLVALNATGEVEDVWFQNGWAFHTMTVEADGNLRLYGSFDYSGLNVDSGAGVPTPRFSYHDGPAVSVGTDACSLLLSPTLTFLELGLASAPFTDAFRAVSEVPGERQYTIPVGLEDHSSFYTDGLNQEIERNWQDFQPNNSRKLFAIDPGYALTFLGDFPTFFTWEGPGNWQERFGGLVGTLRYPQNIPVNAAGRVFLPYPMPTPFFASYDRDRAIVPMGAPPDIPGSRRWSTVVVKLDSHFEIDWTVSLRHGVAGGTDPYLRIKPAPASWLYLSSLVNGDLESTDVDPTDSVQLMEADGPYASYVTKLLDILEPDALAITRDGPSPTNANTITFTVTFDEFVTGVDASDFVVTTTGAVTGASVTAVSGSGSTYTVAVTTGSGEGTIRLDVLDDDTIQSATNESLGGPGAGNGDFTRGEAYIMDYTAPTASFDTTSPPYTIVSTTDVLITFSEPITGLDAADFAVTNGTIANITGDGTHFVITVLITNPGDMTIDLTGGGLTDTAGNGNGPANGPIITFLDLNGDPSVPGPRTWVLPGFGLLLAAAALLRIRSRPTN